MKKKNLSKMWILWKNKNFDVETDLKNMKNMKNVKNLKKKMLKRIPPKFILSLNPNFRWSPKGKYDLEIIIKS